MLKRNPKDYKSREQIFVLKKQLRNLIKRNKYTYKTSVVDKMCTSLSKGQKKVYWKYLKKLEKSTDTNAYIPEQALIDHSKNILQDEKEKILTINKSAIGDSDYKITTEELHTA